MIITNREQELLAQFVRDVISPRGLNADTKKLVVKFARALAGKLLSAQLKHGYTNDWMMTTWADKCRQDLRSHLKKGDPLDVAVYCAFLWYHDESTTGPRSRPGPRRKPAKKPR